MQLQEEETKKVVRSKFQRHAVSLIWKCYLQRQRRWRLLLSETMFAAVLLVIAVLIAKPVFLTPLQTELEPPLASVDLFNSLQSKNILGYAPNEEQYVAIMSRAAELLQTDMMAAASEDELINELYEMSGGTPLSNPVIFVIWKPKDGNVWKFSIRSTERARHASAGGADHPNPYLRVGFLAVQAAVSQAILEHTSPIIPKYESEIVTHTYSMGSNTYDSGTLLSSSATPLYNIVSLVSMPVSPLMLEHQVRRATSGILLCLTLALLPPVLEAQTLVVHETTSKLKRAFRIRHVELSTQYIAWIVFAYLTALPICLLVSFTLILIFRWIHLLTALIITLAYVSVMIMIALIMAMFNSKAWIACLWTTLFTLLNTFLAEMLVHHEYDQKHMALTFILHLILPPLGLVHALNKFAMLQTGRGSSLDSKPSLFYTILSWSAMNFLYFAILMIMQKTIRDRALGGAVSLKSIIFKKIEDSNKLRPIKTPTGHERAMLQEVDELVAKAICFRNCSKSILNVPILSNITMDIYRGEFTILFAERIQYKMIHTIEDLLTGLTSPDEGSITVLGHTVTSDRSLMSMPYMMGYCHDLKFLIADLTVEEHLTLFTEICLWYESTQYWEEFMQMRRRRIYNECELESVRHTQVRHLGAYYRAQLCWALALLMEPRIIFIPNISDEPIYNRVIRDKIMKYKKYVTIVMLSYSSLQLEFADRVFVFDSKILVFGGTPGFMFFKYGREYRLRMTFRGSYNNDNQTMSELLQRASEAGASVRAHLGSLLILRLPSSPTSAVAALVKHLDDKASKYGIISMSISLPDTEEVTKRAIIESKASALELSPAHEILCNQALKRIERPRPWKRQLTPILNSTQFNKFAGKYIAFYRFYKSYFIFMTISTLIAGVLIGISLSNILAHLDQNKNAYTTTHKKVLSVEALEQKTTIVVKLDNTTNARSVANAYVLSDTKATDKEIQDMRYTAIPHPESMTEYLVTRAIDSPQHYVYMYAYGVDVSSDEGGGLLVRARYSPLHHDEGAAARSLARSYMALLRHYTGALDASIQVTDDPLSLDLALWMRYAGKPPLLIQFVLILTISHITLIPSMEHGLVRHLQCNARNFSPARYWLSMFCCDLLLYWCQVCIMTVALVCIVHVSIPLVDFSYTDLAIVPLMLLVYGFGCIPQAYLFSIGPRTALNTMTFVIVNVVFGETTVIAKILYGEGLNYAMYFMRLSPQFNMAYAYVKIKQIFLYNSECVLFKSRNLCNTTKLHKCCEKCGILQECFTRKEYFTIIPGVLVEMAAIVGTAVLFTVLLLLWEYRLIQRLWRHLVMRWIEVEKPVDMVESIGLKREKADVEDKIKEIKFKRREKVDTFGEYLLADNVLRKESGYYLLRNINLGVGKGEVLAVSGLQRHGRVKLCEILAGYKIPTSGHVWCMSKWKLKMQPYMYTRNVSISCDRSPLPHWMKVYDALALLAVLRGVPRRHVADELKNYIEALDLEQQVDMRICDLPPKDHKRLQFAAGVVGAPPVLVMDECTAYQKYAVRRSMYSILYVLKKRGHAVVVSASNVEPHLPITSRLAILVDGRIYDIDHVDRLVQRYSGEGYTVVLHLKDEIDALHMFSKHFRSVVINDVSEVLVNVQVLDKNLKWGQVFERMEALKAENPQVYSYIVTATPIDYIYNSIIANERGLKPTSDLISMSCLKSVLAQRVLKVPRKEAVDRLIPFETKYGITMLKELPWSVIFQR